LLFAAVFGLFDDLLLLKRGGRVVYFGELGEQSKILTKYFEDRGARPIERQENPANWVLTVMTSESRDYADDYLQSEQHQTVKAALATSTENLNEDQKISYKDEYAASKAVRGQLTNQRLMKIYWRSPTYNLSRITVSAGIALILGSVLVKDRSNHVFTETQVRRESIRLSICDV
jgi:ATP-binding cassette, subfamily G (WHITE), member 2, PDR